MFDALKNFFGWERKPSIVIKSEYLPHPEHHDPGPDTLYSHLEQMGRNADEVAEFLTSHNIRGKQRDCFECPVAVWARSLLSIKDGYKTWITVSDSGYTTTYTNEDDRYDFTFGPRGRVPNGVKDFIHAFDYLNKYPELNVERN